MVEERSWYASDDSYTLNNPEPDKPFGTYGGAAGGRWVI